MLNDIRFAFRSFIKTPAFSLVAFFAIALGLGVNTTIFGVVNTLLLKPLPVGRAQQLVKVFTTDTHLRGNQVNSYLNFLDYRKDNTAFSGMAAYGFAGMGMTRGDETLNVAGLMVSGNYFDVLDVQPMLGRGFLAEEDSTPNGHPVAVLGYRFWRKLGGDTGIIGSTITLNGRAFTVIGVAPPRFTGVDVGFAPDMWVPLAMHEWVNPSGQLWFEKRRALFLNVIARLKAGVTIAAAETEMKTMARQLEQAYPDVNKERSIKLLSLEAAKTQGLGGPGNENIAQNVSLLLVIAAASILAISCANVANLLLARATTRQRELAVRLALGAGRVRIIRQLLTESVLLAVLGGLGGVVLAYWLGDVLLSLVPPTPVPLVLNPQPDLRVLIFAFAVAIISGIVFGLAPALQTARWDLTQGLRERATAAGGGAASRWSLRNLLVIAQVSVSLLLLIGSALFLKAFHSAQAINPGFRTENVALITIDPSLAGYDPTRGAQLARTILDTIRQDSRVVTADLSQWVPLGFGGQGRTVLIEGRAENDEHNRRLANISPVTPGYLETMAIPLLRGRKFAEQDCQKSAARVALIDETTAQQFWPNEDPLGRRFRFLVNNEPVEVIGVVRNSKAITLGETPVPMIYLPFIEMPDGGVTVFIHTSSSASPMLAQAHQIIRRIDMHVPITYEKTVREHLSVALWPSWMGAVLLGSLGLLALLLASMGVYGVMAYSVSQRTRELGIRMALGAQARQVVQLVLRQGMTMAGIGLLLGLLVAFGCTRLVATLLYGVNPSDPLIFIEVTTVLAAAAFAACYFPARRAVKIDPVVALRFE